MCEGEYVKILLLLSFFINMCGGGGFSEIKYFFIPNPLFPLVWHSVVGPSGRVWGLVQSSEEDLNHLQWRCESANMK